MLENSPNTLRILEFYRRKYAPSVAIVGLLKALSIASLKVKNIIPLSVIAVAPSGSLKTRLSRELESGVFPVGSITYLGSDFTANAILKQNKEKPINRTCIIVNDLVFLFTSKSMQGEQRLVNCLAELLSDARYDYMNFKENYVLKAVVSLVANVTSDNYMSHSRRLIETTFGERCVTVYYYIPDEEERAFNRDEQNRRGMAFGRCLRLKNTYVDYSRFRDVFDELSVRWKLLMLSPSLLRVFGRITSIACANAVLNGRSEVNEDDVAVLKLIEPYLINPKSNHVPIVLSASESLPDGSKKSIYQICLEVGLKPDRWQSYVAKVIRKYDIRGVISYYEAGAQPEPDKEEKWGGLRDERDSEDND